ncbi:MAG: hypothetical protein KAU21_09740, partial [Gammaproteobacteria bacterium]|nr:hypothetical protein [Gammaproteobacteria bacterium]
MLINTKWTIALVLFSSSTIHAETMTYNQLLQDVIDHYPAIKTAYFQVAKAQQYNLKIQGQLGWQLGAQTGFAKEVSLFGQPVEQTTIAGSLGRKLESGDSINFSASIAHEDTEALANPATSTNLKFEYIKPLGKGAGNIDYTLGLNNAKAAVDIKLADQQILLDKMAQQVIELYSASINTNQRIKNTESSIKRTEKLSLFINDRLKLGIVENKDQLQTNAQLQSQKAQLTALKLAWTQQLISINRLTGRKWNQKLQLSVPDLQHLKSETVENQIEKLKTYSPALIQINSLIAVAD